MTARRASGLRDLVAPCKHHMSGVEIPPHRLYTSQSSLVFEPLSACIDETRQYSHLIEHCDQLEHCRVLHYIDLMPTLQHYERH